MAGRHLKRALRNLHYYRHNALWTVFTLTAAMLLLGLALLSLINIDQLTTQWNTIAQVTLYLDDDLAQDEQEKIRTLLQTLPEITAIKRVEPATTMEEFSALGAEAARLVKGLDPAIFPPALQLTLDNKLVDSKNFPAFITRLQTVPGMTALDYGQYEHEQVGTIAILVRAGVTFCSLLVVILMLFVVFNTIKVALNNRRAELDIQWLVGATSFFIKAPLLWEGFILGGVSGAMATALLAIGQHWAAPAINGLLADLMPSFSITLYSPLLWPVLILSGALMTTLGTIMGVRRIFN